MEYITKKFKKLSQAERYLMRLYNKYDIVKVLDYIIFADGVVCCYAVKKEI